MAASEPAHSVHKSWTDELQSSSDRGIHTTGLELGMSGMSLVAANYSSDRHVRKETESTLESSSPNDNEVVALGLVHHHHHLPLPPHHTESSMKGSAPTSPSSDRQASKGVSRPPGLSAAPAMPSPIGKPGHSKNTSATSPLLTLTPNSSVDGNDWHSLGTRQSPSFQANDAPSMPYLPGEHRRKDPDGTSTFGSFDLADGGNDGLLGLEALRDRANSSPGPVQILSSSPPVGVAPRGHFTAHSYAMPHDLHAEKPRPRDRPPLSHSYQESMSNASGMGFVSISSNRSVGSDSNNISLDSADSRGFGAIGRPPDLRQVFSSDYDPNRRRSASTGDNLHGHFFVQNGVPESLISHKFGTLPTLGSHIQQQRMPESMAPEMQRPRHVRSVSQPMPHNAGAQYVPSSGMDSRFNHAAVLLEGHSYSGETRYKQQVSGSVSNPAIASFFDGNSHYSIQKRVSLPNVGGAQGYASQQQQSSYNHAPSRREMHDYHMGPVASADDIRPYPSMISPGHSPLQVHYGGHSRHNSDAGSSAMLSSSPRSLGAVSLPGNVMHRRQLSGDDDLAHPLIGEHIDVPADHDDLYLCNAYGLPQSVQRHSHSLSMGELPPQYIDASHHLPTAGAALPMPKVVYSVKFKRTQRNFVLGPRISRDLKIGTYVKVEADRGEDLGIVVGKLPADKYSFSRSSFTAGLSSGLGGTGGTSDLKRIIRLATHDEVSLLSMKRDEEEELLKVCRAKVRQRGLPMHVVDAEYQFDRHKLTFFFEAEGRVDFRELVRDLFSMYKTRIWMQQLDKNTSTSAPAMMAPHPSSLQMDYGTPIIAPVSEFADSIVLGGMSMGDARSH